ncbi:LamG-like jellyroll fold domain-containing protein, partial [Calditrichota bacterium]
DCVWSYSLGSENRDKGRGGFRLDNDYIIGGYAYPQGGPGPLLQRVEADGNVLWTSYFDFDRAVYAYVVRPAADNKIIAAGRYDSGGREQMFIMSVDEDGDSLWARSYGGNYEDRAIEVIALDAGGYMLCGYNRSDADPEYDILLMRIGENGDSLWSKAFDLEYSVEGEAIIQTSDGGYLIGGLVQDDVMDYEAVDGLLVKLDADCEVEWTQSYGDVYGDVITDIIEVGNSYITAGYSDYAYWLQEVSSEDGELIWKKVYAGATLTNVQKLIQTQEGGFAVAGASLADSNVYAMSLLKTDRQGEDDFIYIWGGENADRAYDVIQEQDASYTLLGGTQSYTQDSEDFWMVHTAPQLEPEFDLSGNGSKGILTVGATLGEGRWGDAILLESPDGGGFVIEDSEILRPKKFTIEGWFKADNDELQTGVLVGKIFEFEYFSYALILDQDEGLVIFSLMTENSDLELIASVDIDSSWHHIAGSFDGSWMRMIYDGVFVGERRVQDAVIYDEGELVIGTNDPVTSGDLKFYGKIDEVRLLDNPYIYLNVEYPPNALLPQASIFINASPNPFNSSVRLSFELRRPTDLLLQVYDPQGRLVDQLINGIQPTGVRQFIWSPENVSTGSYIVKLSSPEGVVAQKVLMLR